MEIERRQLIHDDAHGDVLALPGVDTRHKTVQDKGVQRTDDALHLRVVGNEQAAGVLRVAHFQVEVVAVLVKYPIALLGSQTGGVDTKHAYHTLQQGIRTAGVPGAWSHPQVPNFFL